MLTQPSFLSFSLGKKNHLYNIVKLTLRIVTELPSLYQQHSKKYPVKMKVKSFCKCEILTRKLALLFLLTVNNEREVEMHFCSFLFYSTAFLAFLTPACSLPFHS